MSAAAVHTVRYTSYAAVPAYMCKTQTWKQPKTELRNAVLCLSFKTRNGIQFYMINLPLLFQKIHTDLISNKNQLQPLSLLVFIRFLLLSQLKYIVSTRACWKFFRLEPFNMDERDLRLEFSVIHPYCMVITRCFPLFIFYTLLPDSGVLRLVFLLHL